MKINHQHYILIICAFVTLCVAGFGYFLLYDRALSQARDSSKASAMVAVESERKQHEQELIKVYNDTANDRAKIISSFVREDKVVNFIEHIEGISNDAHASVELSAIARHDDFIQTNVDIKGSWGNVMRAFTMLENLPYSISINSIRLDSSARVWHMSADIMVATLK